MKAEAMGRKTIKATNSIINFILFMIILALTSFAGYALWDSNQLYQGADKANYSVYKPTEEDGGKSFAELQIINPEVFAWLTVYGTNIDYPVTQGTDNMKYVNTNAEGQYSLSGAIFLDYTNSKDFSDFNSIIYGHHMAKKVMFGEIGDFADKSKFDSHRYGNLYYDGTDYGIEFFAYLHADAYDYSVFTANVRDDMRQTYLDGIIDKSMHTRDIGVTINDRIILLSTCSSESTNGRDLLIGRITDEIFDDQIITDTDGNTGTGRIARMVKEIPLWVLLLVLTLAALLVVMTVDACRKQKQGKRKNKRIERSVLEK